MAMSFLRGAQIFWTMTNSFKLCPAHFSKGSEKFSRGDSPPLRPLATGLVVNRSFWLVQCRKRCEHPLLCWIRVLRWPVFWKSVPKSGFVKINNLLQLQKELTQSFSNYNDSSSESCQDRSFSEVYLLLLTQSLVRFVTWHTHTEV